MHFTTVYEPYLLHPDSLVPGAAPLQKQSWYLDTVFALDPTPASSLARYEAGLARQGAEVGIAFKFGGTVSSSLPAHRVLQAAQARLGPEAAGRAVDALYRGYFEEEGDPAARETLVRACRAAGMEAGEAEALVDDVDGDGAGGVSLTEVKSMVREQVGNGVDATPWVVIEGRRRDITLVGAKRVDEYTKALLQVVKESS